MFLEDINFDRRQLFGEVFQTNKVNRKQISMQLEKMPSRVSGGRKLKNVLKGDSRTLNQ